MQRAIEQLKAAVDLMRDRIGSLSDKIMEINDQIEEVQGLIDAGVFEAKLLPGVEVVTDDNGKKHLEYVG